MPDDDRALMDRLAALEAEVKADADAQAARKEAAMEKVRDQRAKQLAEKQDLRDRQAAIVKKKPELALTKRAPLVDDDEPSDADNLRGALELAGKANRVKNELTKKPKKGQKSWVKSGVASLALGPLGWLYAGSLREAVPASLGWIILASIVSKILPAVLLMPVLLVVLPLSGIAGVMYALSFNKHGGRQRLFGDEKKQLKAGDADDER